ncbi:MAG: PhoH family protein, partial [Clostridia bacterium]|nr:PhoH family protein [Clostridia bacterium]
MQIEKRFSVHIVNTVKTDADTGDALCVSGEEKNVDKAASVLTYLKRMAAAGDTLSEQSVEYVIGMIEDGNAEELASYNDNAVICITAKGKPIKPKTVGQRKYTDMIRKNTVVFGIGPAGTGKTFLAVAMAVEALRSKEVSRIILTRPAVEAGERLGFLPGDLQSKIDPYLRPLYDALFEMLGAENYARHVERNSIEIAPLAYMRGRTLDDSFIILDEA